MQPSPAGASLFRNVLANMGGYFAAVLITFVITPFLIRSLGPANYGAWSLVAELIGYYGLLDMGLRGAVTYYVARHRARHETEALSHIISSAFWALAAMGLIVMCIGAAIAPTFPRWMNTAGLNVHDAQVALFLMSVVIGLSLPLESYSSALVGSMRLDLVNGIEVLNRLLMAAATYAVLTRGHGLIGLSLAYFACRALSWTLQMAAARRLLGGLFWTPALFRRDSLAELASYGIRNIVSALAGLLLYRTGSLITSVFLGVQYVTFYSIGSIMVTYASTACSSVTRSYTPKFTQLHAQGNIEELRRVFLSGSRISGLLAVFLFASLTGFCTPFLRLWVGPEFVTGPWTMRSDAVMIILFVAQLPRIMQSISWQLLFATARVRFLMWINIAEAASSLAVSLALVKPLGLAGVALGVLAPLLVTHLFLMPPYILRQLAMPAARYLREGIGAPLAIGASLLALNLALTAAAPPLTWTLFFSEATLSALAGAILVLAFGFTADERAQLKGKLYQAGRLIGVAS